MNFVKNLYIACLIIALDNGTLHAANPPQKKAFHINSGTVKMHPINIKKPEPFSGPSGRQQQAFESAQGLGSLFNNVNRIMEAAKRSK